MFDHVQIKVKDFAKARRFYVSVLKILRYKVVFTCPGVVGMGTNVHNMFEVSRVRKDTPLSKHVHVAFKAKSKKAVDAFYKKALALGAKDNGKPGLRPEYEPGYYAAFVIDPFGHNLEAVFI